MVDDLIRRQGAIDSMCELMHHWFGGDPKDEIIEIKRELGKLPAVEPERKKGKWIAVDSFSAYGGDEATWMAHGNPIAFYYCSECKEQAYAGEDGESLITEYCPNCGADMRGEDNELGDS